MRTEVLKTDKTDCKSFTAWGAFGYYQFLMLPAVTKFQPELLNCDSAISPSMLTSNTFKRILLTILLLANISSFADWTTVNTGINDNLKSIYVWSPNAIVVGEHGIYYSTSGIGANWTKFSITTSSADSLLLTRCNFVKVTSKQLVNNQAYFCGQDTVNHTGVIFSLDLTTLAYSFRYIGAAGTNFTDIATNILSGNVESLYCVGDNGLLVCSRDFINFSLINTGITRNLKAVRGKTVGNFEIVGDEIYSKGQDDGTNFTFSTYDFPGMYFNDVSGQINIANSSIVITNTQAYNMINNVPVPIINHDFGPLNPTSVSFPSTQIVYVATDHGIFIGDQNYSYLEYSPSSSAASLNQVLFLSSQFGYAAGDNGVILTTNNGGFPVKPYCKITMTGGCRGSNVFFNGIKGTATSCKWLLDSVIVSTNCSYAQTFPNNGVYHATYIVWNTSGFYDTSYAAFYVVDTPQINLLVTLLDSVLCHQMPISLQVNASQNDVSYSLYKKSSSKNLGSATGNGGTVNLISIPVDSSGYYYLKASSILAPGCIINFTDSMHIIDEHTSAAFHSSFINASPGELLQFFSNSVDAQQFSWTFTTPSQTQQSSSMNPAGISFVDTGFVNVTLVAISNHGCTDTLTKAGTYLVSEPLLDDTCWSYYTDGIDPGWQGSSPPPAAHHVVATKDGGFVATGSLNRHIIPSKYGIDFGRTQKAGGYIARYSKNGMLKWIDYSEGTYFSPGSTFGSDPSAPAIDSQGNIYVSDNLAGSGTTYHYNNGDSAYYVNLQGNAIMKLDSLGNPLWTSVIEGGYPMKIVQDKSGDLILAGRINNFATVVRYIFNGIVTDSLPVTSTSFTRDLLMKVDSSGHCIWMTFFENNFTNSGGLNDFAIDSMNNILVTGGFESNIILHSTNNTSKTLTNAGWSTYGTKMFAAKFNSSGVLSWTIEGGSTSPIDATFGFTVTGDANGDVYLTGVNNYDPINSWSTSLKNSNGTMQAIFVGRYFLVKFNNNGNFLWSSGMDGTGDGYCQAVTIHKNKLYVTGNATASSGTWSGSIISSNGMLTPCTIDPLDFFILRYDTSGYLEQLSQTNATFSSPAKSLTPLSISINEADRIFVSGHSGWVNQTEDVLLFGDSLHFYGEDGWLLKTDGAFCGHSLLTSTGQLNRGEMNMKIYPNPATDLLNIKSAGDLIREIVISDLWGREVIRKKYNVRSENSIDISALVNAVYFIRVICDKGERLEKFVKF